MNYEKIETDRYEKRWKSMNNKFSNDDHYTSKNPSPVVKEYIKYLKDHKINGNVLDIGCGNGRNSVLFAKNGFTVHGIDVSESAIKIAKKNAKDNDVKISNQVGSVFRLPYNSNFFDALLDSGCIHHLRKSEWKKYLSSILRVLKTDGHFLLYCFSNNYGYIPGISPKSKNRNWTLRNGHYNHFFTDKEIKDTFRKKFDIIYHYELKKGDFRKAGKAVKVYLMKKK
ncbi:methyltransferase domain-containing protein [archaeon]|nr:methyltransferase domain-containing protein [archaeon]MBL7056979.1 methyltransferase domain-containing protein [Candidatus Woesearchaeota archaeon]